MCLKLEKNWRQRTENLKNTSGILYGYKFIKEIKTSNNIVDYKAPYQNQLYGLNIKIKSDRCFKNITPFELAKKKINKGFHFFTNIQKDFYCETAKKLCPQIPDNRKFNYCKIFRNCPLDYHCNSSLSFKWAQFEIIPNDIIAVGLFSGFDSFVSYKCKLVKVLEEN